MSERSSSIGLLVPPFLVVLGHSMGNQPALTAVDSFLNASKNEVAITLSKDEQLQNMVKLIDACVQMQADFQWCVWKLHKPLRGNHGRNPTEAGSVGSELRTEIRRVGGADEKRKGRVHEEHYQYYPAVQSTL